MVVKNFQCFDMESRRGNAIGKNEANAVGVTHSTASVKTRVSGKIEGSRNLRMRA